MIDSRDSLEYIKDVKAGFWILLIILKGFNDQILMILKTFYMFLIEKLSF
jgi:hypothetical protein